MKMRTIISSVALLASALALSSTASATSICAPTSYTSLAASGGCTLGDLSFTIFDSGSMVDATAIQVTPSGTDSLIFSGPILEYTGPIFVGSVVITALNNAAPINGLSVSIGGGLLGSKEPVCLGTGNVFTGSVNISDCSNTANTTQLVVGIGGLPTTSSAMFAPVGAVDIANAYVVSTASRNSTLTLSVSQVPEPGTLSLLLAGGLGALAFGFVRFRRNRSVAAESVN